MPFQSEKQRRFLHANHPEIAKRWERDYANGGILDINESEEIISDEGNDIELTDYNAAFDDPNDLSTGVKSLFQAKDGGRIGFQGGGADQGGWGPGVGSPGTTSSGGNVNTGGSDRGPRDDPDRFGPTTTTTTTSIGDDQEDDTAEMMRNMAADLAFSRSPASDKEKYDSWAQHLADLPGDLDNKSPRYNPYKSEVDVKYAEENFQQSLDNQMLGLKKMGLEKLGKLGAILVGMLAMKVPLGDALKNLPKTISVSKEDMKSLIKVSLPVGKAKKELIEALENQQRGFLKDVDITNPNEMVNLEETTKFTQRRDQLTDLTTIKVEDPGDKGPKRIEVLPVGDDSSPRELGIQQSYDWLGDIRDKQAQQKAHEEKVERERLAAENPIVSGTERNIMMIGNSGGLANLFRVKN